MAIFLITYDLKQPGRNYQPVFDHIKANYSWCKGLESVWLVDSLKSSSAIRDEIRAIIDTNDEVFVVRLQREWASFNYYCGDWLNKPERNW
jgi:hypothetical protein